MVRHRFAAVSRYGSQIVGHDQNGMRRASTRREIEGSVRGYASNTYDDGSESNHAHRVELLLLITTENKATNTGIVPTITAPTSETRANFCPLEPMRSNRSAAPQTRQSRLEADLGKRESVAQQAGSRYRARYQVTKPGDVDALGVTTKRVSTTQPAQQTTTSNLDATPSEKFRLPAFDGARLRAPNDAALVSLWQPFFGPLGWLEQTAGPRGRPPEWARLRVISNPVTLRPMLVNHHPG
jgi:hypothetical protein